MKKNIAILTLILFAGMSAFSQKKNGTVYSEHETIEKTRELWKAVMNGDAEKFRSFFADSAYISNNGADVDPTPNAQIGTGIAYWKNNFDNFNVVDQKPAYPDAIEYKEGGIWVQDWLLVTGIHKETGIVLDLPMHSLYHFNDEGKINTLVRYFNNDVFQEITNSQTTRENGEVYINHPYIVTVRKAMNAFVAKDVDAWSSFFAPNARFTTSFMKLGETQTFEENLEGLKNSFFRDDIKYKVEQVGYPDCVYYDQGNQYVVYAWWKMTIEGNGKKSEFPFMISNNFNDEGKIVFQNVYVSSNHLEGIFGN